MLRAASSLSPKLSPKLSHSSALSSSSSPSPFRSTAYLSSSSAASSSPTPASSSSSSSSSSSWIAKVYKTVFRRSVKIVGVVSLALVASAAIEYKACKDVDINSPKQKKKKILVLPFHRMKLVEEKSKFSLAQALADNNDDDGGFGGGGDNEKIIEVEIKDLVETIHAAAEDPNIVALYGIFGHGFRFSSGGWAHIEEVRDALRVFKESHRCHRNPNRLYESLNFTPKHRKLMYAYADTFANPADSGNKEYYLASMFTHLHLQKNAELNLFGLSAYNSFWKGFLDKYGIKVHVFKHGNYKNAPNAFTENTYVKPHKENVTNILTSINTQVCNNIVLSRHKRGLYTFNPSVWKMIHDYGTMPAAHAKMLGLVDYLPRLDPLDALLESHKSKERKNAMKEKWTNETDIDRFEAVESISFKKYSATVRKRKQIEQRNWHIYEFLKSFDEKKNRFGFLSLLGYNAPYYNINENKFDEIRAKGLNEKIALLYINGTITDATARKTMHTLKKIKNDKKDNNVKCIIVRVDSPGGSGGAAENILQQFKDCDIPIIYSMGNVAASAGYFIAMNSQRIFASPTTITGSIGVFGIKVDMSGLAQRYGINVEHVTTGPHSSSYNLFYPLTKQISDNFNRNVDRFYTYFKYVVSVGRGMPIDNVQSIAEGRVYTGEQAKDVDLVDELGGLSRVIAYAKRNYTSGCADVITYPRPTTFKDKIVKLMDDASDDNDNDDDSENQKDSLLLGMVNELYQLLQPFSNSHDKDDRTEQPNKFDPTNLSTMPTSLSGIMLTLDENDALDCLFQEHNNRRMSASNQVMGPSLLPTGVWAGISK